MGLDGGRVSNPTIPNLIPPKAIYDRLAQAGQMDGYMQHYFGGSRISDQIFAILL